ncbi:hypothetical protein RhiirA1_507968, partial [Rhizophagus irregularis]
ICLDESINGGMLRMIDVDMNIDCEGKEEGRDLGLDQEGEIKVKIKDETEVEIEDGIEVEIEEEKVLPKRQNSFGKLRQFRDFDRRYANQQATITEEEIPPELFITDKESSETNEESNESEINNGDNNDYEYTEIFKNYAPPVYEQFQDRISPDTNANRQFLWILLWIMSFRKRFNIPEIATEALIQFIKLLLIEIGGSNFEEFPGSLYLARNVLGLKDQNHKS